MKEIPYRQVELKRGPESTTSWIPARFAVVGKCIKLRDNRQWTDGWEVHSVGSAADLRYLLEHERAHLYQREVSDI